MKKFPFFVAALLFLGLATFIFSPLPHTLALARPTNPSVQNIKQKDDSNQRIPVYYSYSPKFDIALGYDPRRYVVENMVGEFDISTWEQFDKYKIVPVTGTNLESALGSVNLREFKFKNPEELINATLEWLKGRVPRKNVKFQKLAKNNDVYFLPFSYQALDYSALWTAYAKKDKNIDLKKYSKTEQGAIYLFFKDKTLFAIYAFNLTNPKEELENISAFRKNLYVSPSFVKEREYQIYGTDIVFKFNPKYWFVTPEKRTLYMTFYHNKYETRPEYAALYDTTAQVFIAPETTYKKITEEDLKERAIEMGASDLRINSSNKEAEKQAAKHISKVQTPHLTFYCYISPPRERPWGGYKPAQASQKPQEYRKLCVTGKDQTAFSVRATIIKNTEGEKYYNKLLNSFYIESTEVQTTTTPTPTKLSNLLDGNIHLIPRVKAAPAAQVSSFDIGSILGPLGTLKIFELGCINFTIPSNKITTAANLANKSYKLCDGGTGTGFAVNDSYILSNAHVMSPPPFMVLADIYFGAMKSLSRGRPLPQSLDGGLTRDILNLSAAAVKYYQQRGARFSSYNNAVRSIALELLKQTIVDASEKHLRRLSNEVWATAGKNGYFSIGTNSINIKNSHLMTKVNVVKAYDITPNLLVEIAGQRALARGASLKPDLALGKASAHLKVVPIPLQKQPTYAPGSKITVVGYPGIIERSSLLSVKSTYPTVTKGTISGIKNAAGANFKIVQINAAVAHGNSGGPVIDETGKVLGVLTYSFSAGSKDAADLAGAVDIKEARAILDAQHISYNNSPLTAKVLKAAEEYNKSHFRNAKKILEEIKQENPTYFAYVLDPILNRLQGYIDQGLDKSSPFTPEMLSKYLLPGGAALLVIGLVVVALALFSGKGKSSANLASSSTSENQSNGNPNTPQSGPSMPLQQTSLPSAPTQQVQQNPTASNASETVINLPQSQSNIMQQTAPQPQTVTQQNPPTLSQPNQQIPETAQVTSPIQPSSQPQPQTQTPVQPTTPAQTPQYQNNNIQPSTISLPNTQTAPEAATEGWPQPQQTPQNPQTPTTSTQNNNNQPIPPNAQIPQPIQTPQTSAPKGPVAQPGSSPSQAPTSEAPSMQ